MPGEKLGYREAMDRVTKRGVDSGLTPTEARKRAQDSITRIDRRVDDGTNKRR